MVLKFEGVDSIDEAEKYRGIELRIGEDEVEALPAGSYYHYQLKGLKVEDPAGGRSASPPTSWSRAEKRPSWS